MNTEISRDLIMIPETVELFDYRTSSQSLTNKTSEEVKQASPGRRNTKKRFESLMDITKAKDGVKEMVPLYVKEKKLPFHGIPNAVRQVPFSKPPKIVDMTEDCAFEKKWLPLKKAN